MPKGQRGFRSRLLCEQPENPTGCTLVGGVVTPPPPRSPQTLYKSLEVTFVSTTAAVLSSALIIVASRLNCLDRVANLFENSHSDATASIGNGRRQTFPLCALFLSLGARNDAAHVGRNAVVKHLKVRLGHVGRRAAENYLVELVGHEQENSTIHVDSGLKAFPGSAPLRRHDWRKLETRVSSSVSAPWDTRSGRVFPTGFGASRRLRRRRVQPPQRVYTIPFSKIKHPLRMMAYCTAWS